jgi:hypothetical protein
MPEVVERNVPPRQEISRLSGIKKVVPNPSSIPSWQNKKTINHNLECI